MEEHHHTLDNTHIVEENHAIVGFLFKEPPLRERKEGQEMFSLNRELVICNLPYLFHNRKWDGGDSNPDSESSNHQCYPLHSTGGDYLDKTRERSGGSFAEFIFDSKVFIWASNPWAELSIKFSILYLVVSYLVSEKS